MALYCIFSTKRAPWWARSHFAALSERPPKRGIKPHMSPGRPRRMALYQIGLLEWLPRRNFTTFFPPEGHFTVFCPSVGHLRGHFTTFFPLDKWSSGDIIMFYLQQGPQRRYFYRVLFFCFQH